MNKFIDPPKSICLLRLSAIGDVTHMLPIIHTLQKVWPSCELTWVIGKVEYQLMKNLPDINFIVFDKNAGISAYLQLRQQLKTKKFDVLLMVQAALRASLASLVISAKVKIGFDKSRARDGQTWFSNLRIKGENRVHVLDSFFQFLQAMGIEQREMRWDLPIDSEAQDFAIQTISDKETVIINPSSSSPRRNWSAENYGKTIDYLIEVRQKQVIITGGSSEIEKQFSATINRLCNFKPVDLTGKTNLMQLAALIKKSELVIAPDTGPTHIATATGTPIIGIYAASNPERTGPYNDFKLLVNYYPEALDYFYHTTIEQQRWGLRVRHDKVMLIIPVISVIEKIDLALSSVD